MSNQVFWNNFDQQGRSYGPLINDQEEKVCKTEQEEKVWSLSFTPTTIE
jgi:hypothetical protein